MTRKVQMSHETANDRWNIETLRRLSCHWKCEKLSAFTSTYKIIKLNVKYDKMSTIEKLLKLFKFSSLKCKMPELSRVCSLGGRVNDQRSVHPLWVQSTLTLLSTLFYVKSLAKWFSLLFTWGLADRKSPDIKFCSHIYEFFRDNEIFFYLPWRFKFLRKLKKFLFC